MIAGPILVTGGSGQVARALGSLGGAAIRVVGRPAFDFDQQTASRPASTMSGRRWSSTPPPGRRSTWRKATPKRPGGPISPVRPTSPDCARRRRSPLIHISTDYVFDGDKASPYLETDPTSPTGVYGASKLAGEHAVLAACPRAVVLRTSWVYAATGKNFVRTMLALSEKHDRLRVVADQRGCPTNADDLATAILAVADHVLAGWRPDYHGVFHAAGTGATTWHGLAEALFAAAGRHGGKVPEVAAIATAEYPTPARRPADSRLDCTKLGAVFRRAPAGLAAQPGPHDRRHLRRRGSSHRRVVWLTDDGRIGCPRTLPTWRMTAAGRTVRVT